MRATEEADLKTFLAAASQALQPLNAARLFTTSLAERAHNDEFRELTGHLEGALSSSKLNLNAGDLKLDAGALRAEPQAFALTDLFGQLSQELQVIAEQRDITFKAMQEMRLHTDPKLLRRVLQNFLSNALRCTDEPCSICYSHLRIRRAYRSLG